MKLPLQSFWDVFKNTYGAISSSEALCIFNLAALAPNGVRLDIGSHAGKSSLCAAAAFEQGNIIMVDPLYDMTNLQAWEHSVQKHPDNHGWGYANEPDFKEKIKQKIYSVSNTKVGAILLGDYSENAITEFNGISYCFLDSDTHQDGMCLRECKLLEDRMIQGGIIAFHDWNSQFFDPKEASDYLVSTGKFEYVDINWNEIIDYVGENNLEKSNTSWHHSEMEFPNFVGAVRRK